MRKIRREEKRNVRKEVSKVESKVGRVVER